MKISGETKLLMGLFVFVVLGAGFLFVSNRPAGPPRTPQPVQTADFGALLKEARHVKGRADAALTVVEFADFECPSCRRAYTGVASRLGTTIPARFLFRHLPLDQHATALPAAIAAEAAGEQGKFWEMYAALFDAKAPPLDETFLLKSAKAIGLDLARFENDRKNPALEARVQNDKQLADAHAVRETPTFFVRDGAGEVSKVVGGNALRDLLVKKNVLPAASPSKNALSSPSPPGSSTAH